MYSKYVLLFYKLHSVFVLTYAIPVFTVSVLQMYQCVMLIVVFLWNSNTVCLLLACTDILYLYLYGEGLM